MRTDLLVWACLALILVAAEVMAPGAFLLWLGTAAAAVFLILLAVPLSPLWQVVAFAVLSLLSVGIARRYVRKFDGTSDQPLLNRRAEQFVGRHYELHSAIVDGHGKVKMGDALWTVTGPDLPVGARVLVTGADSMTLTVVPDPKR
jgi:membrane protein implicated in regulation of membrane protease activity